MECSFVFDQSLNTLFAEDVEGAFFRALKRCRKHWHKGLRSFTRLEYPPLR
jgi:hypothetical protein